jgi:hypothetical protein
MADTLQLIHRTEIDVARWDTLVQQSQASVYNQIFYLDTLSENWYAIVLNDYQGAMAVPYTVRLGIKGIFTPNFIRSLDWMGKKPIDFFQVELLLKKEFSRCDLNTGQQLFSQSKELTYQHFDSEDEISLGSQTKRGIKKFEKTALVIEKINISEALPLIVSELRGKVKSLTESNFKQFETLLLNYDEQRCHCYGIRGEAIHAAIILIEWNNEVLYIKGGVDEFGKQNGLMHALMADSIRNAFKNGSKFSFEGSFVSSVRQFNLGFGAKDKLYYSWKWDNSPWWFKLLLKFKK